MAGLDDLEVFSEPRADLQRRPGELLGVVGEQSLLDAGKLIQQVVPGGGGWIAKVDGW